MTRAKDVRLRAPACVALLCEVAGIGDATFAGLAGRVIVG